MKSNKHNTIDVLNVSLNVFNNLSGNMAGGALLTNALYDNSDLQGYEQSTDKTAKARWKLAYISALDGLDVLCDSRT